MMRALILGLCLAGCGAQATPRVRILGSVDGGPPSPGWVYARRGQRVVLHAELTPPDPRARFRWFALEPTTLALDNTEPRFHYEKVKYAVRELEGCRDQPTCDGDVTPHVLPSTPGLEGLGTMAFQLVALLPDGTAVATPGTEAVERGGLSREVFKVAIRRDDTFTGYLTELLNTPYIFGSDGPPGQHQSELLIGSDCADLCVYAARRSGRNVPFVSTWSIADHAPERLRATGQTVDGRFTDARGRPLWVGPHDDEVHVGDLLLFPASRHVGVLFEDRPPLGVLDANDLLFHTCWAPPTAQPLRETACASLPVRVLRFR
ncbi:MAG: hypothetical protein IRZ16_00965 [Myxococcaceae bacterium]|nr:hypothetical protein [Myxococcaceae bacterium]